MASRTWEYDAFISYAREDTSRVRDDIYGPLRGSRRVADGLPPRVFFDVSEEGVAQGSNFMSAIGEALLVSRKIVLVYSETYFRKAMCVWEMALALRLDPTGTEGRLVPLQLSPSAEPPFFASTINWLPTEGTGWFDRLCVALDLTPGQKEDGATALSILGRPPDVTLNQTLPAIHVTAISGTGEAAEAEVTLSCEGGRLQGTLVQQTNSGVANFQDIAVSWSEGPTVRLLASAPGAPSCRSEAFHVAPPRTASVLPPLPGASDTAGAGETAFVAAAGETVFLGDGSVAVAASDLISLYASPGSGNAPVAAKARLGGPLRLLRRGMSFVAGAEWDGTVHVLGSDGTARSWKRESDGLSVPADAWVDPDGTVYFGYWEGTTYRWPPDAPRPAPELRHGPGVRCLARTDSEIVVCGFDGRLAVYRDRRWVRSLALESSVIAMRAWGPVLAAVAAERLYHVNTDTMRVIAEETGLKDIRAVLTDVERPVVVDSGGKGFCCDSDLARTMRFYIAPGSVPVSANDLGTACVFRNSTGSYALVLDGVVVLDEVPHGLAVSADGSRFTVARGNDTCVVSGTQLREMLAKTKAVAGAGAVARDG
jgi:hypothetical protein